MKEDHRLIVVATANGTPASSLMGATTTVTSSLLNGPLASNVTGTNILAPGIVPASGATTNNRSLPSTPAKCPLVPYVMDWNEENPAGNAAGDLNRASVEKVCLAENPPLVTSSQKEISDLLADPLSQTVSGKRGGQDPSSGLKIKINRPRTNGKNQTPDLVSSARSPNGKAARKAKQSNGLHADASPDDGTTAVAKKAGGKRNLERKDKIVPRSRTKSSSVISNGGDQSPVREPPTKKSKTEPAAAARQQRDATTTASVSTCTEPDLLGPLEPGSSITLDGIVWRETSAGILVINVTWRGKTYVGSLLDCSKHNWVPPGRICDTPPSDSDCNRSSTKDRVSAQKRGRNGLGPVEGDALASIPLRGGKTRRGANFQTPVSPACSESGTGTPGKRKAGRRPNNLRPSSTQRGSEPKDTLSDLPSPTEDAGGKPKRGRRAASGSSTPGIEGQPAPASPVSIECPDPQCGKKYSHINGLRYHLQANKHHEQPQLSSFDEDRSTDSQSDLREERSLLNGDLVASSSGTALDSKMAAATSKTTSDIQKSTLEVAPSTSAINAQSGCRPSPVAPPTQTSLPGPAQSHLDLVLSGAVNSDGGDEDAKQRSKQRRKQSNPVSSQQKRNPDGGVVDSKDSTNGVDFSASVPEDLAQSKSIGLKVTSPAETKKDGKLSKSNVANVEPTKDISQVSLQSNGSAELPHVSAFELQSGPTTSVGMAKEAPLAVALHKPEAIRMLVGPLEKMPLPTSSAICQLPLDLKINSPLQLQPAKIHSPLLTNVASPVIEALKAGEAASFEVTKASPVAYEDISDDETDEPRRPTEVAAIVRPGSTHDKPAFFPYSPAAPYLGSPFVDPDRKIASPADPSKMRVGKDAEKGDSGKSVVVPAKDPSAGRLADPKSEPGAKAKEDLKGPLEDVTATHNKMHPQYAPQFLPPGYRPAPGPNFSRLSPMSFMGNPQHNMYRPMTPDGYQAYMAYGFPGAVRPGPSGLGMPPGMPQMTANAMDMAALQQRIYSPNPHPHKIHELKEESKSENRKPPHALTSSRKAVDASPKDLATNGHADILSTLYFDGAAQIPRSAYTP